MGGTTTRGEDGGLGGVEARKAVGIWEGRGGKGGNRERQGTEGLKS